MANNRLYIGNKETKEYECVSKSYDEWRKLNLKDLKLLNKIIVTDDSFNKKTDLVFFTESDDELYNYFLG